MVTWPGYCGGKPHIAGHRIKVQHVAVWHERLGRSPDEIIAEQRRPPLDEAPVVLPVAKELTEQSGSPRFPTRAIHRSALLERYRGHLDKTQQLLDQSPVFTLAGTAGGTEYG